MTTQFKVGQTYSGRSICDHNCIFSITVLSRTPKTIKVRRHDYPSEVKTLRPYIYDDVEQVKPYGSYSMCTIISADDADLSEVKKPYLTA